MERVSAVVVGGGVVGLACARALAARSSASYTVAVLEGATSLGAGASTRNSGVIHAGLYYGGTESLKGRLCTEGRRLLYDYARERGVPHNNCGKLVVATNTSEGVKLRSILASARKNGLGESECRLISSSEARALEPNVVCTEALWSATTGTIDAASLVSSFECDLVEESQGKVTVAVNCRVTSGRVLPADGRGRQARFALETSLGPIACDHLVNAAGMHAAQLVSTIEGLSPASIPPAHSYFAKGNYFRLARAHMNGRAFTRHVYPVPADGGLGVHATVDPSGAVRFGPDVEWLAPPSPAPGAGSKWAWARQHAPTSASLYSVDESRADAFYAAIRRFYPSLPDGALEPDYAGVRSKLSGPGQPAADFLLLSDPALPQCVSLFGVESPGLTSCLALGVLVAKTVLDSRF